VVVGNTIWYHCVTLVVWCDWLTRIRTAGRITWGLGWPSRVTPSEVVPLLLARRFKPVTRTIIAEGSSFAKRHRDTEYIYCPHFPQSG
jgi:hypothetical protein